MKPDDEACEYQIEKPVDEGATDEPPHATDARTKPRQTTPAICRMVGTLRARLISKGEASTCFDLKYGRTNWIGLNGHDAKKVLR